MGRTITALVVQKRNRQRVNVYLDGEFAFGLSLIVAAWLKVGQELSEEKIAELNSSDEHEVAYQRALKLLEYRPRAEAEVRKKLTEHQFPEAVVEAVLERLRRSGLVDDTRFAQAWVENRSEFRPRSRRALQVELRQHGLDDEAAADALSEVDDDALALQAAVKYARKLKDTEWLDFRRKLTGFLARRGFTYEVAAPVVRQVWQERHSDNTKVEE